jgi:hypothetical protein
LRFNKATHSLIHRRFILIFSFFFVVFSTNFSLLKKNNYVKFTETSEFWLLIITHIYIVIRNTIITCTLYNIYSGTLHLSLVLYR